MPTAAKMVAALCFAVLGFVLAERYKPLMPPGTQFGQVSLICAAIGLLCGWFVMGSLAGKGYGKSLGLGIRTAITTVCWALLGFSIYTMVLESMKGRYGSSPMEALTGAIALILDYGKIMLEQNFLLTMLIGGLLGGILTEFASRRWK